MIETLYKKILNILLKTVLEDCYILNDLNFLNIIDIKKKNFILIPLFDLLKTVPTL